MQNGYRNREWLEFRQEVIDLDGRRCASCGREESEEIVLQVHHKFYLPSRKPWEYDYKDCETLCKGCHSMKHGRLRPSFGWSYVGDEKLEDLSGECEYCGQSIRYVFFIAHEHWEPLQVGIDCCDNLTGTSLASNRFESIRRYESRAKRFVNSARWEMRHQIATITQKRIKIDIRKCGMGFQIYMNDRRGKQLLPSIEQAKLLAFEAIESGKAEKYLARHTRKPFR